MITLTPLFISLLYHCLMSPYPGLIQRLYCYLPGSRLWMRRWRLLLLEKLGSWFWHQQMQLFLAVTGCLLKNTAQTDLWIDIRPVSWPKIILRHIARLFWDILASCQDEFYQDYVLHCC